MVRDWRRYLLVGVFISSTVTRSYAQPADPGRDLLTSGWQLPYVVAMPQEVAAGPIEAQQPFFDDFAWRSFIALNWPAAVDASGVAKRGVADPQVSISKATGSRVWESWKAAWELFKPTHDPLPFDKYDQLPLTSNRIALTGTGNRTASEKLLVMTSKADSLLDEFNEALTGPLIDQNRNYVRYEIRVNRPEYDAIRDNKWYLASNLPQQVNFASSTPAPVPAYGAVEIKAAWRELIAGKDDFSRYYWTEARLLEPGNPMTVRQAKMGLIGLHIVHKVSPFREWVWSTFEQVDNVPDPARPHPAIYSLNNGTAVPETANGFYYRAEMSKPVKLPIDVPLPTVDDPARTPVQVTRFTPIRADTQRVNTAYQTLLHGTPWEFYELIPTQWPTVRHGGQFNPGGTYPKDADQPFPVSHVANTAAETYFQNTRETSCIECHYQAAATDFSWMLAIRSAPDNPPALERHASLMKTLSNLGK